MSPIRTIVAFGTGPGIGNHTVAQFASHGFNHAVLLARNESRLQNEDTAFVAKASSSIKIDTIRLDLSDLSSIPSVLQKIDGLTQGEDVEVVFFNAARIKQSGILEVSVEEIEEDFRVQNLALYIIAQHYIPRLQTLAKSSPSARPSLLVTNSHLPWAPVPPYLSLSLVKASQRNMVQNFNQVFSESNVHIGLITCEGPVSLEKKYLTPNNIAQKTWGFYEAATGLEVNIKE